MPEPVISYLRLRVVNTSPLFYFTDGFEGTGSGVTANLWNSIGTDATGTITRWNQVAGAWAIAANVVTAPATTAALMTGGHTDWGDSTFTVRFKWVTGASPMIVMHCDGTDANWVGARTNGATLFIDKVVGGVFTNGIVSTAVGLTNNVQYWLKITGSGTTYTASVYTDSAGAIGALVGVSISTTVADAGLQTGIVGLRNAAAVSYPYGGAFSTVCTVTGTPPDGTQGQAWNPVVTTGEPAFAWSKLSPQAGTYSASIRLLLNNDNGAWQQTIRLFSGTNATLSGQQKASAGTANITAGGLTTGNAGTSFASGTTTGAITANPTVSCNYSGTAGTAYFDTLSITNPAYEITSDLPHLHQTHWERVAIQPGNPGSTAQGAFTVSLFAPYADQYLANQSLYSQIKRGYRVEAYTSPDGASLGRLYAAGIITDITLGDGPNPTYSLSGVNDVGLAHMAQPFPGETLAGGLTSGTVTLFSGTNEPGHSDNLNPYTSANYVSTAAPTKTAGSWSSATSDGIPVVVSTTGSGAALLSKMGAASHNTPTNSHLVEATGNLTPSADTTNAGILGVGLSGSNANCNTSVIGYVTAKRNASTSRWDLDAHVDVYVAGALSTSKTSSSALTNTDETGVSSLGIPLAFELLVSVGVATLTVNGSAVISGFSTGVDAGDGINNYPFLYYGTPASGTATGNLGNLVQMVRYTASSATRVFAAGSITTTTNNTMSGNPTPQSFLEVWSQMATREGFYWRFTPTPYVLGSRTLGTLDFNADPGTDRTASVTFRRGENLVGLTLTGNADAFVSSTRVPSASSSGSGGLVIWRDIPTLQAFGALEDQTLGVTAYGYPVQRRLGTHVMTNKAATGSSGSKTAVVVRDPQTADVFRELDRITLDNPELGVNMLSVRVLAITFDEGQGTQALVLDQFSIEDATIPARRFQTGIYQIAGQFGNR